jgi:hypothetical protein
MTSCIEILRRIVEEGSEVGAIDKLHGKEKAVILSGFQITAIHHVSAMHLAQRPHLT